jgi:tRNA-binding EMAP/Myf-like protein
MSKIPDFLKDIKDESLEASVKAGDILPRLEIDFQKVYKVKVVSGYNSFKTEYGQTFALNVEYEGMKMSVIAPISFRFQVASAMIRKGMDETKSEQLIGKNLFIRKVIGDTKQFKNATLYNVQIE